MPRIRLNNGAEMDVVGWANEPMHQLVVDNSYTRIYRIRFPAGAGAQTLFHRHTEDTVYLCVSDGGDPTTGDAGLIFNQVIAEGEMLDFVPFVTRTGACFCSMHKAKPLMHRIKTSDLNKSDVCFIGAELLARPYPPTRELPEALHHSWPQLYSLELESSLFRVYRLALGPGAHMQAHTWHFSGALFVAKPMDMLSFQEGDVQAAGSAHSDEGGAHVENALSQYAHLKELDAVWFDGPLQVAAASNASTATFELFVVEWC